MGSMVKMDGIDGHVDQKLKREESSGLEMGECYWWRENVWSWIPTPVGNIHCKKRRGLKASTHDEGAAERSQWRSLQKSESREVEQRVYSFWLQRGGLHSRLLTEPGSRSSKHPWEASHGSLCHKHSWLWGENKRRLKLGVLPPATLVKPFPLPSCYCSLSLLRGQGFSLSRSPGRQPWLCFSNLPCPSNQEVHQSSISELNVKWGLFSILREAFLPQAAHLNRWGSDGLLMQWSSG